MAEFQILSRPGEHASAFQRGLASTMNKRATEQEMKLREQREQRQKEIFDSGAPIRDYNEKVAQNGLLALKKAEESKVNFENNFTGILETTSGLINGDGYYTPVDPSNPDALESSRFDFEGWSSDWTIAKQKIASAVQAGEPRAKAIDEQLNAQMKQRAEINAVKEKHEVDAYNKKQAQELEYYTSIKNAAEAENVIVTTFGQGSPEHKQFQLDKAIKGTGYSAPKISAIKPSPEDEINAEIEAFRADPNYQNLSDSQRAAAESQIRAGQAISATNLEPRVMFGSLNLEGNAGDRLQASSEIDNVITNALSLDGNKAKKDPNDIGQVEMDAIVKSIAEFNARSPKDYEIDVLLSKISDWPGTWSDDKMEKRLKKRIKDRLESIVTSDLSGNSSNEMSSPIQSQITDPTAMTMEQYRKNIANRR